jgi:hypothetical protein
LTFSNSSSAVIFPSTTANYGTGSFTVEMAFKPTFINGRHYLMSKNSGSFPNWTIYLSGSNGSGKLWSEFRPTAAISCSVSSSTTFVTGSVYQVDVSILPALSASGIYINGQGEGGVFGNGGGSLSSTASLFIGNFSQNNTQNFSGSIYTAKIYSVANFILPTVNYNATSTRFLRPPILETSKRVFELLVVAGGGGGQSNRGAGGGAGGLQYFTNITPTLGSVPVIVGSGGTTNTNGQNSQFNNIISIGGGRGQSGNGGSGGGANNTSSPGLGTPGQGNNGGSGQFNYDAGGGGGGSSTAGTNTGTAIDGFGAYRGGNGGSGSFISAFIAIGGSPAGWFAGGGGGGGDSIGGLGGIGGGGSGNRTGGGTSTSGSINTGGGGGGDAFGQTGKAGGSGIVAIRYNGAPIAIGGEITQSAGYTYHVFRTVGTSSFTIF